MADTGLIPVFTTQFSARLDLALQQMGSKLRGKVDEYSGYVGKQASPLQLLGAVQSRQPQGRFAPKINTPQSFTRRWVFPQDRVIDQYFDTFDQLRTIVEPKGKAVEGAAMACGRDWDDAIIAAAYGTAQTGADAGSLTNETFSLTVMTDDTPSGYIVEDDFGASAAVGLTVAKMIEARRQMRHFHCDFENDPATIVIGSSQEADLLKQVQVTNKEYNRSVADNSVLVDGKLSRFVGFDVVVSERLPVIATTTRGCLAFVKSGIHLGIWKDVTTQIFQRPDLDSNPWDVSTVHTFGATRTQLGKVMVVAASDAVGADITP
jgi:Phage capsid protein